MKSRIKILSIIAVAIIGITACESDDDPVIIVPPGDLITVQLGESVYENQMYFELNSKTVTTFAADAWDLSIQTDGSGDAIYINSAIGYHVYKTTSSDINEEITLPEKPEWMIDDPSGNPAKTAFGKWADNEVYIVGMKDFSSQDPSQQPIKPFARIAFSKSDAGIMVKWKDLTEADAKVKETTLEKTASNKTLTWFNFSEGGIATHQPPLTNEWDIVFTPYTAKIPMGPKIYFYNVNGALTNRLGNTVSYKHEPGEVADEKEYNQIFSDLTADDVDANSYSKDMDVLGYNWKKTVGDPTKGGSITYQVLKSNMYFIKNQAGKTFKFRFTNFYKDGEKGFITFEYVLL
ncbi:hypothetical protein DMA11_05680 [Marinilabiliaceae bacterium JC017]|nr:hypothetical protein DMA11_05680 [Marinilabiliaceae bacterium JC017]